MAQRTRLAGWAAICTLRTPLLWILHASYAWLVPGLILLALSALGLTGARPAFHVLAVGAMEVLIMGMITCTALGHMGRPLQASHGETVMYLLVQVGVGARLLAAVGPAGLQDAGLLLSAACWTMAFLMYAVIHGLYLSQARIDAREGQKGRSFPRRRTTTLDASTYAGAYLRCGDAGVAARRYKVSRSQDFPTWIKVPCHRAVAPLRLTRVEKCNVRHHYFP